MQFFKSTSTVNLWLASIFLLAIALNAGAQQVQPMHLPSNLNVAPPGRGAKLPQTPAPPPNVGSYVIAPQIAGAVPKIPSPNTICGNNPTPRVISIQGMSGYNFSPALAAYPPAIIRGCGFVGSAAGAKIWLSRTGALTRKVVGGVGYIPLIIDRWSFEEISAHIDANFGGVPNLSDLQLNIQPSYGPLIVSGGNNSFTAAEEEFLIKPVASAGTYSNIYGRPTLEDGGDRLIVSRRAVYSNLSVVSNAVCQPMPDQDTQMVDTWPIDSFHLAKGFRFKVGQGAARYENLTDQTISSLDPPISMHIQEVVGVNEPSVWIGGLNSVVSVRFQGHSDISVAPSLPPKTRTDCTSKYAVSFRVIGPRGVKPVE